MDKFFWVEPSIGHGFYLIPTIHITRTDFRPDILPYVSYLFIFKIFRLQMGFQIRTK